MSTADQPVYRVEDFRETGEIRMPKSGEFFIGTIRRKTQTVVKQQGRGWYATEVRPIVVREKSRVLAI